MNFLRPVRREIPEYFTPLWSLAVEEQFYLVWPFCVYFLSEKHLKKVALLLILIPPILRGVCHFSEIWPVYMLTPFRMDLLASGAMLSLIYREDKEGLRKYGPAVALVLIAVGLFGIALLSKSGVTTYGNSRVGNIFVFESSLLIAVGMITWGLCGKFVALLNTAALRYIGQVSYTMYLIHVSVLILLEHYFSVPVRAAVAFVIVLLFATISWFGFEQPILSLGSSRRRSVSPASAPLSDG